MWVDARVHPTRFLSQREYPELAKIAVAVQAQGLVLQADGAAPIEVPQPDPSQAQVYTARIWKDEVRVWDAGDAAASWIAARLGLTSAWMRLVHIDTRQARTSPARAPGHSTWLADAYPLLIVNQASLEALNAAVYHGRGGQFPMNRFRPNLVLAGLMAWEEDTIETLTISAVRLRFVKPCIRCEILTTDQNTGTRWGEEPLLTLARLRHHADLGGASFGWYAVVEKPGALELGAPVEVGYRF